MNWDSFVPDLVVAVISALIAVFVAAATYFITLRQRERNALQSLIEEMHRRRALSPVSKIRRIRAARRRDDFDRMAASVLSLRDEIARTRESVREIPDLQEPMARMRLACNRYLELSERDPNDYFRFAAELRRDLAASITSLVSVRGGLTYKEPGGGALA